MTIQTVDRFGAGLAKRILGVLSVVIALAPTVPTVAQSSANDNVADGQKPTALTHPRNPMIWDVDAMMDQAIQQISNRYSLTPDQQMYTRLLLTRRVREFLDEHESEVRELLQESMDMQTDPSKATPVARQIWAQRALPLYAKASQAILEGNEEWGEILNEDQKKIHDGDMNLMRRGFDGATSTLSQWSEGKGPPIPQRPTSDPANSTSGQADKTGEGVTSPPVNHVQQNVEDNWRSYVNLFVTAYDLDKAAQNSAREKIYKEQFNKAARYRQSKAADFQRIEKRLKTLGKTDYAERQKLMNRQVDLEKRIYELFVELDERLQKLPTAAQVANVDLEQKKHLEQLYDALSGKRALEARKSVTRKTPKPDAEGTDSADKSKAAADPKNAPPEPETKKPAGDEKPESSKTDEDKSPEKPESARQPEDKKADEKPKSDEAVAN